MTTMASQITSLTVVYSIVYSGADQRKHQSSASLAFVRGIHRSTGEFPVQRASNAENVSIDDVIMCITFCKYHSHCFLYHIEAVEWMSVDMISFCMWYITQKTYGKNSIPNKLALDWYNISVITYHSIYLYVPKPSEIMLHQLPLIWTWTNGWVHNRDAGDLRSHRAHYDVTVMTFVALCHNSPPFTVSSAPQMMYNLSCLRLTTN